MTAKMFERPVQIFVGLGFPREVETVFEAYQVLAEWPGSGHDRRAAIHACRKALRGAGTVDEARKTFEAFASRRGILASEAMVTAANKLAQEWLAR